MRRFLTVFFVLFLFSKVNAQAQLRGKVVDEQGSPLSEAFIYFPELGRGTLSAEGGQFHLDNLPEGPITVQCSFIGYGTFLDQVPSNEQHLRIQLISSAIETEEVVVSGGAASAQHENAVKIEVLAVKDMQVGGALSTMQALTKVPGVDMMAMGPGVAKPVIRGLSMNNILTLNNGFRVENYQYGEHHPLGIDASSVERVEIIKGPASLLYGSDAIGGVVNFIKTRPAPVGTSEAFYTATTHSNSMGLEQSVGYSTAGKNLSGALVMGNKSHSDYLQGGGDFVPNTRFNERVLNGQLGYTTKRSSHRFFYDLFNQDLGMSVEEAAALNLERGRTNENWFQDLSYQMLSTKNTWYTGGGLLEANAALQRAHRSLVTEELDPNVEMRLNTMNTELKWNRRVNERSNFTLGVQNMFQDNANLNNRTAQFLPNATTAATGLLATAQHYFNEHTQVQWGARFDANSIQTKALGTPGDFNYRDSISRTYANFNGSIGMTHNIDHRWVLRANLARGYRAPTLYELTTHGLHGNQYEMGNPDLVAQNALELDASVHYHADFISFDAALFRNDIANYIFSEHSEDTTPTGLEIVKFEQADALLYGGEAGLHVHPKALPWMHAEATYAAVIATVEGDEFLNFVPANKIRYEWAAELGPQKNPWELSAFGLYAFAQNRAGHHESPTEAYHIIGLSVRKNWAWNSRTVETALSISNLFDTQYFDHLSALKPLGYYNTGRNISLNIRVPIL